MAGISEKALEINFTPTSIIIIIVNADTAQHSYMCYAIAAAVAAAVVLGPFSFPLPKQTLPAAPQGAGQHQSPQEHHHTADA